ncbi:DUF559 domain-containing protein [Glaciihabitans sp. INWT7]|nr:DUF559 domain-containing protein [Glaciihabitans sp. INWT7]
MRLPDATPRADLRAFPRRVASLKRRVARLVRSQQGCRLLHSARQPHHLHREDRNSPRRRDRDHHRLMSSLESSLRSLGGVAHVRTLGEIGIPHSQVERAAAIGRVVRVRPGVYAALDAHAELVRAARVGGRLAGASAARAMRLWVPPDRGLVVEVSRGATHLRDPDDPHRALDRNRGDVRILWTGAPRPLRHSIGVASIADMMRQLVDTEPDEYIVAILDSLLRRTETSRFDLEAAAIGLSAKGRSLLSLVDDRADSGSESVVRVLLAQAGCAATPQVRIPFTDLDRIDLLVGDRLVIECDSEQHHGGREQRLRDLRRDAALACLGFIVLRFDWRQIFFEPASVVSAVLRYVELGLHRF